MLRFRFPLEKVLQYRARTLETEQARLAEKLAILHGLEAELEALVESRRQEGERLLRTGSVEAGELEALAAFLHRAAIREKRLGEQRAAAAKASDQQREAVLKARREHRLIERLREKRRTEWELSYERELQQTADENFTSRWTAERHEKFI
ncbi:MAG: flagellar FliJ family protein [Acidobacteria bacterium]|nr:flagellar FliJ family protein [Acidobacteriota bacterium]